MKIKDYTITNWKELLDKRFTDMTIIPINRRHRLSHFKCFIIELWIEGLVDKSYFICGEDKQTDVLNMRHFNCNIDIDDNGNVHFYHGIFKICQCYDTFIVEMV